MEDTQRCGSCKEFKAVDDYSPSYRGKPGTWCRACFAAYNRGQITSKQHEPLICGFCSKRFVPLLVRPKVAAHYCSRECKESARKVIMSLRREASKPPRSCVHCGSDMSQAMRVDAKFCSDGCNSAAHNVTRKMAKRAGYPRTPGDPLLDRNRIATRDNFRCGLCGDPVDMKLKHPDPMFGSIDHVIPLALGGGNEDANLQLAHLVCNLRKRSKLSP